jgi:hypothetical protein
VKEKQGFGPETLGDGAACPPNPFPRAHNDAGPCAVTQGVPGFPTNPTELAALTKQNIHPTAARYNHDFGIAEQEDNLAVCRQKFRVLITDLYYTTYPE